MKTAREGDTELGYVDWIGLDRLGLEKVMIFFCMWLEWGCNAHDIANFETPLLRFRKSLHS